MSVFVGDGRTYSYMPDTVQATVRAVAVGWLTRIIQARP